MGRTVTLPGREKRGNIEGGIIDCDVHNAVPSIESLFPHLPDRWVDYMVESGIKTIEPNYYPKGVPLSARPGSEPAGGPAGSDLGLLRDQLLDPWNVRYAMLNCVYGVQLIQNREWAMVMASALNDWQIAEWLEKDGRLRASITVSTRDPGTAAREIERVGGHPGFAQVLLLARSEMPYGERYYWPIYEAAERHGLPVCIHAGGSAGNPITSVGWPSYYIEDYVGFAQAFQAQVVSMVTAGVFAEYPGLRVVLAEAGITWLPSLMWRFDKDWKGIRRETPWVSRPPSEIIREHVRLTTQPIDEPSNPEHLLQVIDQIGSEEMLLFSTDYPHWHFDEPEDALPVKLPPDLERKIFSGNARALYGLDDATSER
ncbi:amidohydrolase family protein [Rubrobacter tropicus]|uniref:amidohydrolase family protein n=1 Tax=Rubrobacter tropicus TaxID=2653851 RepID=UPI001A9F9DD0|nr:amidohydrolase family protein [Rubrobacter tropicus]